MFHALNNAQKNEKLTAVVASEEEQKQREEGIGQIRQYAEERFSFPQEALTSAQAEQLFWLLENVVFTSESNAKLINNNDWRLIEVKRVFSRIDCTMSLLNCIDSWMTSREYYQEFTKPQLAGEKLSPASFVALSELVGEPPRSRSRSYDPYVEALLASCILTKSNRADKLARERNVVASPDSEKFMTDTLARCPDIYPAYNELSDEAKDLLPYAFLADSHGRHMLYTEGGDNMFEVLRTLIEGALRNPETRPLAELQYKLWFARWVVNIAGFRGHVHESTGSLYLTERTANDIFALKASLDKLWETPDYDVLGDYLQKRADSLGINSLYLAHIGALTRLHTQEEGSELQAWFDNLPSDLQKMYEEGYEQFRRHVKVTPTYEPAVIDTMKDLGLSIADRLTIYSILINSATKGYSDRIEAGDVSADVPLCYREIARKDNLEIIIDKYRSGDSIEDGITVNEEGVIYFDSALRKSLAYS